MFDIWTSANVINKLALHTARQLSILLIFTFENTLAENVDNAARKTCFVKCVVENCNL